MKAVVHHSPEKQILPSRWSENLYFPSRRDIGGICGIRGLKTCILTWGQLNHAAAPRGTPPNLGFFQKIKLFGGGTKKKIYVWKKKIQIFILHYWSELSSLDELSLNFLPPLRQLEVLGPDFITWDCILHHTWGYEISICRPSIQFQDALAM